MRTEIKQEDITLEASLLKALAVKKNFDNFYSCLEIKRLIPITSKLLFDYKKWYEKYNKDIDFTTFYPIFSDWHQNDYDDQQLAYYRETVFPLIEKSIVSDELFVNLLERDSARKITMSLEKGLDDRQIITILDELRAKKQVYTNTKDDELFKLSEQDLSALDPTKGLTWALKSLQAGLNSHMPGQFVVLAADSDVGKSALCITQATHVFRYLNSINSDRPILYCTSEDTKEDLTCRFFSCLFRDTIHGGFEEIVKDYYNVSKEYQKNFNDELFLGMQIRSAADLIKIRHKVEKHNPQLIVIDMLDKLSNSDNIQDLTRLYQDIRGIANDGFQIIGTSQTGNTSYQDSETKEYKHRKWLSDKDLANSKSGKQGAAYCMIMIGKDDAIPNIRYLSTTKKKRGKHVNSTCELIDKFSFYKELL